MLLFCCALAACAGSTRVGAESLARADWSDSASVVAQRLADQQAVALAMAPAVVSVRADWCGTRTTASGFLIGGVVVTNAHVVGGAESVDVTGPDFGGLLQVSRVASGVDLAIAPAGITSDLAWAETDALVGESVVLAARGRGGFQWQPGEVQLYAEPGVYGGDGPAMLLDGATVPGFSGGPVINLDGQVVGVLRAVDLSTGLAIAEPVSTFRSWSLRDKYEDSSTSC